MSRLAWIVVLVTLTVAPAAAQHGAIPDLRGTWKGQSESIIAGTFSSPRGDEKFVAAISRNNTILVVDDDGYTVGTILAPNRMEWCYMHRSETTRMVSCTELTKQP
jgi:hypothetical protein